MRQWDTEGMSWLGVWLGSWLGSEKDWVDIPPHTEGGDFYWTVLVSNIVNSGREKQGSISMQTSWGVLPPRELGGPFMAVQPEKSPG